MISADSKYRAALAANSVARIEPIAKLGAMSTPTPGCSPRSCFSELSRSSSQPVVPTTACMPCSTAKRTFASVAVGTVRSMMTSALTSSSFVSGSALPSAATRSISAAVLTARTASDPMRPFAPSTATRHILLVVISPVCCTTVYLPCSFSHSIYGRYPGNTAPVPLIFLILAVKAGLNLGEAQRTARTDPIIKQ